MAKFAILGNNAILVIREIFAKDTGKYQKKKKNFVWSTQKVLHQMRGWTCTVCTDENHGNLLLSLNKISLLLSLIATQNEYVLF